MSRTADIDLIRFEEHFDCIPNWYTPLFIAGEEMIERAAGAGAGVPGRHRTGLPARDRRPRAAADLMLAAVPEMDEELIRVAADYYAPKFTAERRSRSVPKTATWQEFESFLVEAGLLQQPVDVDDAFTNDFLPRSDRRRRGRVSAASATPTAVRLRSRRSRRSTSTSPTGELVASSGRADAVSRHCCGSSPGSIVPTRGAASVDDVARTAIRDSSRTSRSTTC